MIEQLLSPQHVLLINVKKFEVQTISLQNLA